MRDVKQEKSLFFGILSSYEQMKFHAQTTLSL